MRVSEPMQRRQPPAVELAPDSRLAPGRPRHITRPTQPTCLVNSYSAREQLIGQQRSATQLEQRPPTDRRSAQPITSHNTTAGL